MKLAQFRYFFPFFGGILFFLTGIFFNVFAVQNAFFGALCTFFFLILTSFFLGKVLFPKYGALEKGIFGGIVLLSELILTGTFVYYTYKITPLISFLLLFVPLIHGLILFHLSKEKFEKLSFSFLKKVSLLPLTVFLLDAGLLQTLFTNQTTDVAASPWLLLSPWFFIFYGISTGLLFWNYQRSKTSLTNTLLTSLHIFVGMSVTSILYPLGYGFDAFIHRATEQWIFENGFILPKAPYYIGQYSLVVVLAHLSSLPLKLIDSYLLPILSSLLLPTIVFSSIQKSFPKLQNFVPFLFWIIYFLPFLFFSLTLPHNIVVFLTLITIFCLLLSVSKQFPLWILFLFSFAAICTHALVGIPLFIVLFFYVLVLRIENVKKIKFLLFTLVIALALLLPTLFTLNAIRTHTTLPAIGNPLDKISTLKEMFARPYWYADHSNWYLETLYLSERLIVPFFLFCALLGTIFLEKEKQNKNYWIFTTSFLGFVVSAFTLASSIVFPDVVAYEQKDYPLRLLRVSLLFLIPSAMFGIHILLQKIQTFQVIQKHKKFAFSFLILLLSLTFTCILYLSYPQRNIKARFPGYNVTSADIKAVEWIHARHNDYNYIVLANQLVSAAALDTYSFAKYFSTEKGDVFYYAIPTGGKLYEYYGAMIYRGQKREYMEDLMNYVGVSTSYFVVNSYWGNSAAIIEGASQTADEIHPIENGKIWVFVYHKKTAL